MGIEAAIIGAGVLGAGASVVGSSQVASASGKAAETSAEAGRYAADVQMQQYQQTRADMAPWRAVGGSALNQMASILGLPAYSAPAPAAPSVGSGYLGAFSGGGGIPGMMGSSGFLGRGRNLHKPQYGGMSPDIYSVQPVGGDQAAAAQQPATAPDYSAFFQSPDYQFRLQEGTRALEQSAAARGLLRSGQTLKGITEYGQGLAASGYSDYMNRLASLAGVGQSATTTTAGLGQQMAGNVGNIMQNTAAQQASSYLAGGQAWQQGIQGVGQGLGFALSGLTKAPGGGGGGYDYLAGFPSGGGYSYLSGFGG